MITDCNLHLLVDNVKNGLQEETCGNTSADSSKGAISYDPYQFVEDVDINSFNSLEDLAVCQKAVLYRKPWQVKMKS